MKRRDETRSQLDSVGDLGIPRCSSMINGHARAVPPDRCSCRVARCPFAAHPVSKSLLRPRRSRGRAIRAVRRRYGYATATGPPAATRCPAPRAQSRGARAHPGPGARLAAGAGQHRRHRQGQPGARRRGGAARQGAEDPLPGRPAGEGGRRRAGAGRQGRGPRRVVHAHRARPEGEDQRPRRVGRLLRHPHAQAVAHGGRHLPRGRRQRPARPAAARLQPRHRAQALQRGMDRGPHTRNGRPQAQPARPALLRRPGLPDRVEVPPRGGLRRGAHPGRGPPHRRPRQPQAHRGRPRDRLARTPRRGAGRPPRPPAAQHRGRRGAPSTSPSRPRPS
ncbi:hypothetical protein SCYAM73S_03893 [Streptomyces cyaneofuscatus]